MHRAKALRLVVGASLLLGAAGCERRAHLVQHHLFEFGTLIEITLIAPDLGQAERLLADIETRLSRYRRQWQDWEDDDITRFWRQLAQDAEPDADSLEPLLRFGIAYYRASGGLFNPAPGESLAARELEPDGERSARFEPRVPGIGDLDIDATSARADDSDFQVDLGGIARSYALGLIAQYLDQGGIDNYVVNADGDLQVAGNRFGRPWRVAIHNPFAPGTIAALELDGRYSLFTSGNYLRQYRHGPGRRYFVGAANDGAAPRGQTSATVLARDPVRADIAATVLMLDAARKSADLALSLGIEEYLVVSESRMLLVSRAFAERLEFHIDWPRKFVN